VFSFVDGNLVNVLFLNLNIFYQVPSPKSILVIIILLCLSIKLFYLKLVRCYNADLIRLETGVIEEAEVVGYLDNLVRVIPGMTLRLLEVLAPDSVEQERGGSTVHLHWEGFTKRGEDSGFHALLFTHLEKN
jgi:hypothetical protein